jgi:hypothetical protein
MACEEGKMKARDFLLIEAVVLLIVGLAFLINATWVLNLFGVTLGPDGVLMTQLLGAAVLGFAALNYVARYFRIAEEMRPIILANFVMNAVGFGVMLWHRVSAEIGNVWSWIPIILLLLSAVIFAYGYLARENYEEPRVAPKHA